MNDIIDEILTRGVEEVIDRKNLETKLRSKKKLRIKLGIDPTSKNIHIGRAVALWKLRALQELGHKIVIIVGDFTALIGDTSDKDSERPALSKKQVKENLKGYIQQVGLILDLKKTETHYNSKWLKKLGYLEIAEQANLFSLHEFEARENISKRMKSGQRVGLREVLYPLMQGYDSVAIKADVEVGGTDQRFNLLAGRTMQKYYKQQPQDIMTFQLLEGTDGRKMSSSWGNVINITDSPEQIFGKTMSITDSLIIKYFTLCTQVAIRTIKQIETDMDSGLLNPRIAKAMLGIELVAMYHGRKAAEKAAADFDRVHKDRQTPEDIKTFKLSGQNLTKALVGAGLAKSSSDARRLILQGGVKVHGVVIKDPMTPVSKGDIVQVGKRNFARIA